MTLVTEWQFSQEYLDFVVSLSEDPPDAFQSTRGEHGYESARVIFSYLPRIYIEDPYLRDLFWSMAVEIDALRAALDSILASVYVDFAPEWGLQLWEEFAGLLQAPSGLTDGQRRARVAQQLNVGAVTPEEFVSLVAAFSEVSEDLVDISEDFVNYHVTVTVQAGLTSDQQTALQTALRTFLPAHIDFTLQFGGFIVDVNTVGDTI